MRFLRNKAEKKTPGRLARGPLISYGFFTFV